MMRILRVKLRVLIFTLVCLPIYGNSNTNPITITNPHNQSWLTTGLNQITYKPSFRDPWYRFYSMQQEVSIEPQHTSSFDIDTNGIIYVAYVNPGNSSKISVKKFDGYTWSLVGTEHFSEDTAYNINLSLDKNNVPYVAYRDKANSNKTIVKKFNGISWITVGNPGISPGYIAELSLKIDNNNTPYISYFHYGNGFKIKKFNGTSWIPQAIPHITSVGKILFDTNNILYLLYPDQHNQYKATLKKLIGNNWVTVGDEGFSKKKAPPGLPFQLDNNNTPYITYTYYEYNQGYKFEILKFNGSSWENMSIEGLEDPFPFNLSLSIDKNNTPHVIYTSYESNERKTTVKRFNGNSWESIGEENFLTNSYNYNLQFTNDNTPYLSSLRQYGVASNTQLHYLIPIIKNSVKENNIKAIDIDATDKNNNTLTYSLIPALDAHIFNINSNTGVVTFKKAPDYENPLDIDKNNIYEFDVKVVNTQGKITRARVNVTIQDIPAPEFTKPITPTLTTTPTATTEDTVAVEVNGEIGMKVFVNGIDTNKVVSDTGRVIISLDTSGADGKKVFNITLKDSFDNESDILVVTIIKDTAKPLTPSLTTTPTATTEDTVAVEVNGEIGAKVFVNGIDTNKVVADTGKVTISLDTSGADGEKTFNIRLKKPITNIFSETLIVKINKDSKPPEIISGWPGTNQFIKPQNNQVEINYVFSDNGSIKSIKIYNENNQDISDNATIDSHTINLIIEPNSKGKHTYKIIAIDDAGNEKEITLTFTVIVNKPITIVSHSGGLYNTPIKVDLTSDKDNMIYYSIDGLPPVIGASNTYFGKGSIKGIEIKKNTNLQYFAVNKVNEKETIKSTVYRFNKIEDHNMQISPVYNEATHQVELSWNKRSNIKAYNIYKVSSPIELNILKNSKQKGYNAPNKYLLKKTSSNTLVDTNIENGATYHYAISVIDNKGIESLITNPSSITITPSEKSININDSIDRAKNWLIANQNKDGSWGDNEKLKLLTTSSTLDALYSDKESNSYMVLNAIQYLLGKHADNNDYLSRQIITLSKYNIYVQNKVNKLISQANITSGKINGWGLTKRYKSSIYDTALAHIAVKEVNSKIDKYLNVNSTFNNDALKTQQGYWGWTNETQTNIFVSSLVYSSMGTNSDQYSWILNSQNNDGSFGSGLLDTIGVILNLELSQTQLDLALKYIVSKQELMGSYNNDPYLTSLALQALQTKRVK